VREMLVNDWKEFLIPYEQAVEELKIKFKSIRKQYRSKNEYSPIEFLTGRVKEVSSMLEKAKKLGVEFVSQKLPDIYQRVVDLEAKHKTLIFFCERGGLRSSTMVSLLAALGINAYKLTGGYKGYRAFINERLPVLVEEVKFIVIYGNTGTGKTNILKSLRKLGQNVLDLEECANHRGSLLGSVGIGEQNSQKQFESLVYEALKHRSGNTVFTEGESKRIGKVIIPEFLFKSMEKGLKIKVEANMDFRIKNILEDYVNETDGEIIEALEQLRKYAGSANIDRYIDMINQKKYEDVIEELMVKYYDPMYENVNPGFELIVQNNDNHRASNEILDWLKHENIL
jgi:tRNA 2-selenouridine synthase